MKSAEGCQRDFDEDCQQARLGVWCAHEDDIRHRIRTLRGGRTTRSVAEQKSWAGRVGIAAADARIERGFGRRVGDRTGTS